MNVFDVNGAAGFYRLKHLWTETLTSVWGLLKPSLQQELQALTVKMLTSGLGIAVVKALHHDPQITKCICYCDKSGLQHQFSSRQLGYINKLMKQAVKPV